MTEDIQLPPQKVHYIRETTAPDAPEPFYDRYETGVPIAIDFGAENVRAGLTNASSPCNVFPNLVAKHRDRKTNIALTLVGNDIYREANFYPTIRSNAKSPYDGQLISNWDYVESILDYSLEHLQVTSKNGRLNNPVIMTEPAAAPHSYRKGMYEIIFEAYQARKATFGIDSLFSFYANSPSRNGMVVSVGHNLTHVIPVVNGKGILSNTKRIDWGGDQQLNYLQRALALKYPYFPTRLNNDHTKNIIKDHAYVSTDYASELHTFLDMENLESKDVVIQVPVDVAPEKNKKSEEELARQAEKRKEQGRRLQEQAQKKRMEKIAQNEKEFEYYSQLRDSLAAVSKTEAERRAVAEDFESVADLNKYLSNLERSLKRARQSDDNEPVEELDPATAWPLAEVPDAELNDEEIKEKRKQKLMKSNYEARMRIKEEKQNQEEQKQRYLLEQQEWRDRDLRDWCNSKRLELAELVAQYRSRAKQMEAMKDRKSMAAQQRMKNIADLASEQSQNSAAAKKRKRNGPSATIDNDPTDTFGSNDADWNAYRDISNASLEEEQEVTNEEILRIEAELLDHDPDFHTEDTLAASDKFDWRNLVLHKFIHGPRPNLTVTMQAEGHEPEDLINHPEIIRRNHQIHVNVERIRIPEIYFQPHIAGLDLAGITEIIQSLLTRNFNNDFNKGGQARAIVENVLLTGGGTLLPNFCERVKAEMTLFLPTGTPIKVYRAKDPMTDAWRGMQKWSMSEEAKQSYVTKQEYEEYGPEYIKEHSLGNVSLREF